MAGNAPGSGRGAHAEGAAKTAGGGSAVRVRVSGIGVVSPHGDHALAMFEALMQGRSAVRRVFPELPRAAAAATVDFDQQRWFSKLQLAGVDRVSQLAVAAADLALSDAGLGRGPALGADPVRVGVYTGCGMGGVGALDFAYHNVLVNKGRVPPLTIPALMPNAPAAHVAMRHGVQGPVLSYSVACASGAVAISEAAKAIRAGEIDIAIAGGSEALVVPGVVMSWQAMQTLAGFEPGAEATCCKPFAADRSGFVLGEGAAYLVLEAESHAAARGARSYGLLAGAGLSCDATHLTKPDAAGQARAIRSALAQAGLEPGDIGYCNAHGTATKVGDAVEVDALTQVWGDAIDTLPVSSTKALHGHLLGATGALEAAITVLALQQRRLPPNAHAGAADPALRVNLVGAADGRGIDAPGLRAAMSNSFAFGGTNSVLIFTG